MPARLTTVQATERLGVRRETLYAYVSRGVLRSERSADGRTSTFDPTEVEELARRGRPRRATHGPAIDVPVRSALTRLDGDRLTYRGRDAVELSGTRSFEQVAEWLWTGRELPHHSWGSPAPLTRPSPQGLLGADDAHGVRMLDLVRLAAAMAACEASGPSRHATAEGYRLAVMRIVSTVLSRLEVGGAEPTPRLHLGGPTSAALRGTVAARLAVRLVATRPTPELVSAVNAALVLLADHELAVSTLAARVAASARSDGFGVVGAGLGPLVGPLHGGYGYRVRTLLEQCQERPVATVIGAVAGPLPGFGHLVYRRRDPRADALVARVLSLPVARRRLAIVEEFLALGSVHSGSFPNVDFALTALAFASRMPSDSVDVIFALARTVGWTAHAIEELDERPLRFRSRTTPAGGAPG